MQTNKLKDTNLDNLMHTEEIKNPLRAKLRFPNTGAPNKRQPKNNQIKIKTRGDENSAIFVPPCDDAPLRGGLSL